MNNDYFIRQLREIYKKRQLIPFVGAGCSLPFGVPDWKKLIQNYAKQFSIPNIDLMTLVNIDLEKDDYWEALRVINKYAGRTDRDIQEYICKEIPKCINDIDIGEHNYADIGKMNVDAILTTNYDGILNKFLKTHYSPVNLTELSSNTQLTFGEGSIRIFHLHGNISQQESIVISKEQYKQLYSNNTYNKLFSLFQGTKTFLFIGCSLSDIFLKRIIDDNNQFFSTKHYILLDSPDSVTISDLKSKYNIETIVYDGKCGHAPAIRHILDLIMKDGDINFEEEVLVNEVMDILLDSLPNSLEKQQLEESYFCKKMRLEKVNEEIIDYSKDCFYTAEQYIRWLNKSRFARKNEIIRFMFDLCYTRYRDLFIRVFSKFKDSEMLVNNVHEELLKIDFSRIEKLINKEYLPTDANRQGFIHILADDTSSDKEVWWGEKRFE